MIARLVGAILLVLVWVNPAIALVCDFSSRQTVEAALVGEGEFLAAGRGAVAIGEGHCLSSSNRCARYLLISHCETVRYLHPGTDATNPFSLVFVNSAVDCTEGNCSDSFLSAAMLFEPDPRYRAQIEFIRNNSLRWTDTEGVDTRGGYRKTVSRPHAIVDLVGLLVGEGSEWTDMVDAGVQWHSSFRPGGGWFGGKVFTWAMRDRVLWPRDLARCGAACAMKLFLIKFEEAQGRPSSLLRISGRMAGRTGMELRTHGDTLEPFYDRVIKFEFVNW